MMMHAYQETLVNKAQIKVGQAFDVAINQLGINGEEFVSYFIKSSISKRIELGDTAIILGKSGNEIVCDIIYEILNKTIDLEIKEEYKRSKQYWIGWSITYYQWFSDRSFKEIFKAVSYSDLEKMYSTLHEADISKFTEIIDKKIREYYSQTNLKKYRTNGDKTQRELADISGVSLRSIQMYEQRQKDINKASGETLYRLSKALSIPIELLIEK